MMIFPELEIYFEVDIKYQFQLKIKPNTQNNLSINETKKYFNRYLKSKNETSKKYKLYSKCKPVWYKL